MAARHDRGRSSYAAQEGLLAAAAAVVELPAAVRCATRPLSISQILLSSAQAWLRVELVAFSQQMAAQHGAQRRKKVAAVRSCFRLPTHGVELVARQHTIRLITTAGSAAEDAFRCGPSPPPATTLL
jgi:hypothetical protein